MAFVLPTVWNSQPILPMPSTPGLRTVDITMNDTVSVATSPFTRQRQVYDWLCDSWEASVTLPPLSVSQIGAWTAWMASLRGQVGNFWLGNPYAKVPQGSALGSPAVLGGSQRGRSINTTGWNANAQGVLLPGDYFQIGVRLYMALTQVNAAANGSALISIWPQLRESPLDGSAINTTKAQGLFALSANARKFTTNEKRTFGITFTCVESL